MRTKSNINGYVTGSAVWAGFLSFALIALSLAFNSPSGWQKPAQATAVYDRTAKIPVQGRALTFAERVVFQRAIEEVYWRHRIWPKDNPDPKPSLDAVMSQAQLERKVTDYLRNSQELEDYWQKPITAEQLQAEMNRIVRDTRQPEVLRELFEALGNDPLVIAECLARPILAECLIADFSAQGQTQHVESQQTDALRAVPVATRLGQAAYTLPKIANANDPSCTDQWETTTTSNAPSARYLHTAVWTGSEMIIWGGYNDSGALNTGGRYNPSTDSWAPTSTTNAPTFPNGHTAVWTGSEMIVWGQINLLNTGGRYNPSTDSWIATSTINAPSARDDHTAIWTGSEMIVWGGMLGGDGLNTGGRYNPSTNTWRATSMTNAPTARYNHTAIWTGSEMIVWGGEGQPYYVNTGGRYNPSTDSWTATSTTNSPTARHNDTAVWTGSEMIVWGGISNVGRLNTGGRYNPSMDSWIATSTISAPGPRTEHTAVWTGSEMIIWGGYNGSRILDTGGRYNPSTDSWTATSTTNAPSAREVHTAVWTGSEMIIWGGTNTIGFYLNSGWRYCAQNPTPAQLGNISTRAFVQTGDNVVIGGFIVQGAEPKRVIIRAIGPELTQYGVPNAMANPTLELHDSTGALIASNDNWRTTIIGGIITANQVHDIQVSGYAPGDGRESAIIAELPPGNYTAIVRGVNDMTGVALAEVYDLSPGTNSILGNISTRSFVQTGDDVMIGGFIVQGSQPKRVIIRAIGPELGGLPYNVPNALADPTLELHDGTGVLIASNDNWMTTIIGGIITSNQVQDIMDSGHAPTDPRESAIIATLPSGNYTAIVRGVTNSVGVGLVEVYDLD
jgi:N-acetylneuraminic acid mutarotase